VNKIPIDQAKRTEVMNKCMLYDKEFQLFKCQLKGTVLKKIVLYLLNGGSENFSNILAAHIQGLSHLPKGL
jgi:hypothetical protein